MSSPMKIYNSHCDDSDDTHTSSTEPLICDCQNQLGHFDWNGVVREDLPDLCRRTLGIRAGSMLVSSINESTPGSESDNIHLESSLDTDPDHEWDEVVFRRANRNRPNGPGLNRKASASEKVDGTTNTNSDADRPKGRKRRMSDGENGVTWTSKKTKKGTEFRIKLHTGKKRSTVKICVEITKL